MVTIVIKDNTVPEEDILAYIEREHIEGDYEIITQEEYHKRVVVNLFSTPDPSSVCMIDLRGEVLERERKQRNYQKQQQKYARRFYNKRH